MKFRALSLALLWTVPGWAQAQPPDTLVSPEVHSDRRVTFRIRAPKAAEVIFFGDWMPAGKQEKMGQDAAGVWSLTLGSPRPAQAGNTALFEKYLLKDVLPLVEAKYRVAPGRRMRAITGLSMGGGQSLSIGLGHLESFSAIGAFSAAAPADLETRFAKVLDDATGTNARLSLLWIGCGKRDSLFERSRKLSELLAARRIRHTFRATEGAHTYTVWRQYLGEFAPLLFR